MGKRWYYMGIIRYFRKKYWEAAIFRGGRRIPFSCDGLTAVPDRAYALFTEKELEKIYKDLKGATYEVSEIKKGERTKKPPLPFTTSTLQQECAKHLNFATSKTMRIAQQLYEGVAVKGHGTIGLITYLRTDSTRVSQEADAECKAFIRENYGEENVMENTAQKKDTKKIQDAHEAIRPTYVDLTPAAV